MDRFLASVTIRPGKTSAPVLLSPGLLSGLDLAPGRSCVLRFGLRRVETCFRPGSGLGPAEVSLPRPLALRLDLTLPLEAAVFRYDRGEVGLGPLIGLLISRACLRHVLACRETSAAHHYACHAREMGAVLCLFCVGDVDPAQASVKGYVNVPGPLGSEWIARRLPLPRVVYDRVMGARGEAIRARVLADRLGFTVLNRPQKIQKLESYELLRGCPDLVPSLPFAEPLTPLSLAKALTVFNDLYLKPDSLAKGIGVCRLRRRSGGWMLRRRTRGGNTTQLLRDAAAVEAAVGQMSRDHGTYLIQEGLPLATYLGNRFDLRSLVQRDGTGRWTVTGLVARIAPRGSPITSPRSGGWISPPERVLRHAFPTRWVEVLSRVYSLSLDVARCLDERLGPCCEFGLDLGVQRDGAVKVIEVNGKPLKVSLERLGDPLAMERIYRCPIHYAAYLDIVGVDGR